MFEVGLFWEQGFPAADVPPPDLAMLRRALDGFSVRVLGAGDLSALPGLDLLVLPFGSAFPAEAWPSIHVYLSTGGNLLNLGGMPLTRPCTRQHVVWSAQPRQMSYLRDLGFRYAHEVDPSAVASLAAPPEAPLLAGLDETVRAAALFALMPDAQGAGPDVQAITRPLLQGLDASGRPAAAPVVAMDHVDGAFRGGRWVFALLDGVLSAGMIRRLAFYAALGASDLTVASSFPCYYPGEVPRLAVHASLVGRLPGVLAPRVTAVGPRGDQATCELPAIPYGDRPAYRWSEGSDALFGGVAPEPGFYQVEVSLASDELHDLATRLAIPPASGSGAPTHRSGFWVRDEALMRAGPSLSTAGAYLAADGIPHPTFAVSYDPSPRAEGDANVSTWDADMGLMRDFGFGMVRLDPFCLRTAEEQPDAGTLDESFLRSIDALVLSARRHGLLVSLDPLGDRPGEGGPAYGRRHVDADVDLLSSFVERYQECPGVLWEFHRPPLAVHKPDGEPDGTDDTQLEGAWHAWLQGRTPEELRSQWRLTAKESIRLPVDTGSRSPERSLRQDDVTLFSRHMARRWLGEMRDSISSHGAAAHLVADVAGVARAAGCAGLPLPPGSADLALCGTCRTEEDVLAQVALAATGVKPLLPQVVAGDLVEDPDGWLHTSEGAICARLERMLALAVSLGSAGAASLRWQPGSLLDWGLVAGLVRTDRSATPALRAAAGIAAFLERSAQHLCAGDPEPVVILAPVSHLLAAPDIAGQALAACVRAACARARVPLRFASEVDLERLGDPRLILVPYPRALRQDAWDALLAKTQAGASLLVTGPVDRDGHWRPCDRLAKLGVESQARPVSPIESISVGGKLLRVRFGADKSARIEKAVFGDGGAALVTVPQGAGKLLLAPVPMELADEGAPLEELYEWALAESGVAPEFSIEPADAPVLVRPLLFSDAVLYALLSQTDDDQDVTLLHGAQGVPLPVHLSGGRAALLLVDRTTGGVLDRY